MEIHIKTSLNAKQVKKHFADIPEILSGRKSDRYGLRRLYNAVFARRLLQLIHQAFTDKAEGRTDSLGKKFKPLSKNTIRRRQSPKTLAKYPLASQLLIMRLSDKLYESLRPGKIVANQYQPPTNQLFREERNGFVIGTEVEYAAYQHKKRPLWPTNLKPWIEDAANEALTATLKYAAFVLPRK